MTTANESRSCTVARMHPRTVDPMTQELRAGIRAIRRALNAAEDAAPLDALAGLTDALDVLLRARFHLAWVAHEAGHSYSEIGEVLGVTKQQAMRVAGEHDPDGPQLPQLPRIQSGELPRIDPGE